MKEQKTYKIEKVYHSPISGTELTFHVSYYPSSDTLSQANFFGNKLAKLAKTCFSVGQWRVKPTDK